MQSRYVIEVIDNINKTTKNAYFDNKLGSSGDDETHSLALRKWDFFPMTLDEVELERAIDIIKKSPYYERGDGSRLLPKIIRIFGGMNTVSNKVDITVNIYKVYHLGTLESLNVIILNTFTILGTETKGRHLRSETQYTITDDVGNTQSSTCNQVLCYEL